MQPRALHVVSMYQVRWLLAPFLVIVAWAIRPDSDSLPSSFHEEHAESHRREHMTLHLHSSGNAQVAKPRLHGQSKDQHHSASASELAQVAEKSSPRNTVSSTQEHKDRATVRRHRRACGKMAELVRMVSSSLLQVSGAEPDTPPSRADIDKESVIIDGEEYIEAGKCESATDVVRHLIDQERHVEVVCMIVAVFAALIAIISISIWIGMALKPPPPIYWNNHTRHWFGSLDDTFDQEVDVTEELLPAVQRFVDMTTTPDKMGMGRDGSWQTHKKFKVTKVFRMEHGKHWSSYANARAHTQKYQDSVREMPEPLRKEQQERFKAVREVFDERTKDPIVGPFLQSLDLDKERNEVILFHGSPMVGARNSRGEILFPSDRHTPLHAIKKQGFDERLGNAKGMLGSGTYFGDHVSKADCYAGRYHEWKDGKDPGSIGEKAAMFLARVTLGCPYITTKSLEQLRRPPCLQGHFDSNLAAAEVQFGKEAWTKKGVDLEVCEHRRCDCVIADLEIDGDRKNFREYVLYEKKCYPEFLFFYERLP